MNEPKVMIDQQPAITNKVLLQNALPRGAISQVEYSLKQDYLNEGLNNWSIRIPLKLQKAVLKRQVEFMAGRRAYQLAFSTLMGQAAADPLHQDSQGRPLWPSGIVGSISHSHGVALAAVASDTQYLSLGIDIEREVDAETAIRLAPSILVESERQQLLTQPSRSHTSDSSLQAVIPKVKTLKLTQVLTWVFAAKEALFKALNPICHCFFGFEDAECLDISLETGEFRIQLRTTLSTQFPKGRIFQGQFIQKDRHIIALIALS